PSLVTFQGREGMVNTSTLARRLIPQAIPRNGARAKSGEWAIIIGLMLIGLVAHGLNMFNYPAFTFNGDEGIYTQQALAVLQLGQLAPRTYFYDPAPGGLGFPGAVIGRP